MSVKEKFQQALDFHQAGQLSEAKDAYLRILEEQPQHANSLHFLGVIAYQEKNLQQAVDLINKAIAINPNSSAFYSNLGVALMDLKKFDLAAASYKNAIELNPNNADFYYNHGNALKELEKFELATASYRKAIELNPNNANYYHNLGNVLKGGKKFELAVNSYNKSNQIHPDHETYSNCGNVLLELRRVDEAVVSYSKAIELKPDYVEAYLDLGCAMFRIHNFEAAIVNYNKAIKLKPDYVEAYLNLGSSMSKMRNFEAAIIYYNKAIELKPDYADAYSNLGTALVESNQLYSAIVNYKKAIAFQPDCKFLLGLLFNTQNTICDWDSYDENSKKLENKLLEKQRAVMPFPALSMKDSPNLQLLAAEIYAEDNPGGSDLGEIPKRPSKISQGKKIRIGYYSSDFRNHAVAYLIANLFEAHDKSKFELIAFSFGPKNNDDIRNRISAAFDQFIDVESEDDRYVVNLSRKLEIDIAVDLNGFTQYMRMGIFAERCAPIQVNYLGYPGTMGAPYIDYIIADKTLIPEENQRFYSEKIVYLPGSYQVNDSKRQISDKIFTRKELGLPEEGFVYCCFNNNYKIAPETFDGWMRILKSVKESVLWLLECNATAMSNLKKEAEKRGVDSSRLVFAKRVSPEEHLARHKAADLFIDTLPYNAHTTCSDALWAGLPVLTLIGESFAGRVAASLLNAIELPELITNSREEYEAKAIELANNSEQLKEIKRKLERNRLTTALFDINGFTNHIEQAYEIMYDRYHADLLPSNIEIKN